MLGFNPLIAAAASAALVMALAFWWFGVYRRRRIEMESGIAALADMKWRECQSLVLKALAREGYVEPPGEPPSGDGGSEHVLSKHGKSCLFAYKHGTAYQLGDANVRELASAMQLQGAEHGLLVTLGGSDGRAHDMARHLNIELLDATALWPRVRSFLSAEVDTRIRLHAAAVTRRGIELGLLAGAALGVAVYVTFPVETPAPAANPHHSDVSISKPTPVPSADSDAAMRQANAAADAFQAIAELTDADRATRRVAAATAIGGISQVRSAVWSTQSTLVLALASSDGNDQDLVAEACRILVQYEELRFSRLQLEPPNPNDQPVRWRQCQ